MKILAAFLLLFTSSAFALSDAELESIGKKIWQNECAGTKAGLTDWNTGENFASLGIGHFIWYPRGVNGPFEESFPKLVKFFEANGRKIPAWLHGPCPWPNRAAFQAEISGPRLTELRDLLAATIHLQSQFLAERMHLALPKMLSVAPSGQRAHVQQQFNRLAATGAGTFALIDYVNFKGEGTKPEERYNGEGWGLLQVLAGMQGTGRPAKDFSNSAAQVLTRRVQNAPSERHEERWLPGWKNRVHAY